VEQSEKKSAREGGRRRGGGDRPEIQRMRAAKKSGRDYRRAKRRDAILKGRITNRMWRAGLVYVGKICSTQRDIQPCATERAKSKVRKEGEIVLEGYHPN